MQEPSPQPGRSNYLDFELEIGLGTGREYPVTLLRSPAGEAHATMHFPFDELALDLRLGKLQIALLRSGGKHRRAPSEEEEAVQDLGRSLFSALFSGRVRTCYDVSLREAAEQEKGLRLKLRIRPPELSALPWELLYDPDQAEYVCLSRLTPIVRYLESHRLVRPLTVSPPLRILGMVASPQNLPPLDIEREVQRMERATQTLQDRGLLELEWMPGQTWRDLQEAMWGGPWHVFHFIGHGGFDVQADEGFIALADSDGQRSDLTATRLSRLLADHAHLRLVLLNACEGGRGSERDIYSSTASILVHRGIPAVLAMQYAITDRAAIEFARAFYRALAYGMAVDEAVVAARKAIDLAVTNTVEWGTPVLYMRTPDGVLFHVTGAPQVEAPTQAPPVDAELERRLEQRYTAGLSAFWLEKWDEACGHFQAIVGERPDYEEAADNLAEARRQKGWSALYEQAQIARQAEDWETACSALEALVAEKPDYKDAAALLEAMNRRVRLADLYAQAQRLHQAGQWQAVVNVFVEIDALDPDYADPEGLLDTAKQELAGQARRAELDELYSRAVREMDAGRWQEAQRLLRQVKEQEPGYLETAGLLARAESEIARERQQQAEDRRQEQIASLYAEAQALAGAGQWQPALDKMIQIHELDPQFPDPEGIYARARTGLDREEKEVQRRRKLATLYTEAVGLVRAKRFEEALDKWAEVQAIDPAYPDSKRVQAAAQRKLAARDRPALWRRLPRGAWVAIGAVALVAVLVAGGAVLWLIITATLTPTAKPTREIPPQPSGPPEPAPVPDNPSTGTVWEWSDGSAMVYVPAGPFWMGSDESDPDANDDEKPQHEVTLDAFWIDRTEVTNAMFARFVAYSNYETDAEKRGSSRAFNAASGEWEDTDGADWQHPYGPFTSLDGLDKHPVVHVSWNDAAAYCQWAGKRLPTEAEWEKAARGTDKRIYPWGNAFDGSLVSFCDVNCELDWRNEDWDDGYADTAPVGNYPGGESPYGAWDMAGNVWEWTGSLYKPYPYDREDGREDPEAGGARVLRGGSWLNLGVRASPRNVDEPSLSHSNGGFRCARSDSEPPEPEETSVTIAIPKDPAGFNVHVGDTGYEQLLGELVLLGLTDLDPEGNLFPELAAEVPTLENGRVVIDEEASTMEVTWELRDDVYWADGEPVTVDDVIFTWDAINDPEGGIWVEGVDYTDSLEKIDDYTFVVHYSAVYPNYRLMFGGERFFVWPAHYCDAAQGYVSWDCNREPLSSGPYLLEEWATGEYLTFVRNPNYCEEGQPNIENIVVRIVPERAVIKTMLIEGDADVYVQLTPTEIDELQGVSHIGVTFSPITRWVMRLIPNLAARGSLDPEAEPHPILSNVRVRHAIRMAIDVDTLISEIFHGYYQPVWTELFRPPYACDIPRPEYNPEESKALLEEAGWIDTDGDGIRECHGCLYAEEGYVMTMENMIYGEYGKELELAQQLVAEQLLDIGIRLELSTVRGPVLWADYESDGIEQRGDFDLNMWDDGYPGIDPTDHLWIYYYSKAAKPGDGWNVGRWYNEDFDALLNEAYTLDEEYRKVLFCEMATILDDELPQILLWTEVDADGYNTHVEGVQATVNDATTWNVADWRIVE